MMRRRKNMLHRLATAVGLSLLVGTTAFAADPAAAPSAQAPVTHPLKPGENGASETVLGPYLYDGAANIKRIGRSLTEGGTPVSGQTGTDVYVYDQVNRLVSGSVRGGQGAQTYTYDAFGNRLSSSTSGVGCVFGPCQIAVAVDPLTNRLKTTGMAGSATYDASGNLTSIDGTAHQYTWDDAGMMTRAVDGTVVREFIYGPDDERLAIYDVPNGKWTWELRGTDAKVLREVTSTDGPRGKGTANWAWSKDYVYRDGLLLASVSATGTYHYHLDHLGTPRLITDGGGARIAEHDDYPFGAEVANGTVENPQERMKFTGHERDTIAGDNHTLDYMHARYYGAGVGRFVSSDPVEGRETQPQSWNEYSYVRDSPIVLTDPTGKCPTCIGALVGGIVGVVIAGGHEIRTSLNQPVTWTGSTRRILGAFAGGAVSGAVGTTCGGCILPGRLGLAIGGNIAGGALNRMASGQNQSLDALQRDAIGGAAGFGIGELAAKGGTAVAATFVDDQIMKGAAARAEASAQNLGLGGDKAVVATTTTIERVVLAGSVSAGETTSNLSGSSLPDQSAAKVPPKEQP